MTRYICFIIMCISFVSIAGLTKSSAQTTRPKVGLVLSGGGAKGIAHIGVLKAMEEAGLTPDYITGTSMGSIVGALYACGYSADELKEVVEEINWAQLFSNKMPLNKVTFEEKPYYGRYLVDFYMKDKQLQLPKGIIEGHELIQFFSNLTREVHGISDFNKLPIPFACVGSDIATGKPVVLNKGSLALSMRASMAIPSIFTPVKIDDHLLVDGGLVRNMPVPEVLDMGADIVIGVFVSSDLDPEENLTSAISILAQSAFISSAFDTREQLAKCDVLITPDLADFSTGSFSMAPQILEQGAKAGEAYRETFKRLADSLNQFGPARKVIRPAFEKEYVFHEIQVEDINEERKEFIMGKLGVLPGETIAIDELDERLDIIYGTQYFEKIWYEVLGSESHRILKIYAIENLKTQVRFSYHYDSENKGGIVLNATLRNMFLNRSRVIFEADLATFPRVTLDYFKYLGKKQNLAFEAAGIFTKNELPAFDSLGNVLGLFSSNLFSGGGKLQTTTFLSSAFGIEAYWNHMGLKPKVLDDVTRSISKIEYNNTTLAIFHRFDNTNDRYFPTRGWRSEIKLSTTTHVNAFVEIGDTLKLGSEELGNLIFDSNINALDLSISPIIPISPRLSLITKARLKLSNLPDHTLNLGSYDYVGGFIPNLSNSNEYFGISQKEYLLANYFYSRLGVQYKLTNNIYLQAAVNYIDSKDFVTWLYPNADVAILGDRYNRFGYAAMVGFSSPLGPIAVAVAHDHYRKDVQASLIIGFYY